MSQYVDLARSERRYLFPPLPHGLDGDPEGLGNGLGRPVMGENLAFEHAPSLSKLEAAVNHAEGVPVYAYGMDTPGNRLREMRKARGLTLEQVAKVAGISLQALSMIETGKTKNIRPDNFLRLCAFYDADPYYVVFGKPKPSAPGLFRKLNLT